MKSKYIKIFMIFAVVFAMVAGLFVTPALVNAEEQQTLTAKEQYDVDSITQSIPDTAIISFPVPYQSVYGNKIDWSVEAEQSVITYDEEAHWMVVNRPTDADATVELYLNLNGKVTTYEVKVPAGVTAVPLYKVTLNYGYNELSKSFTYKLGEATKVLEIPSRNDYKFDGWYTTDDYQGQPVEKILVGSMENITLYAKWTELAVDSITLDTTNVKKDYKGGEALSTDGLKITAHWNDGSESTVESGFECDAEVINWNEEGKVIVTVTYQGKTASYEVNVTKNENSISDLTIQGWTYGQDANAPTATASFGTISYVYSNAVEGKYSATVPTNAGTYYVKAVVEESLNYTGATSEPVSFTIAKKALTLTTKDKSVSISSVNELDWEFTSEDFVNGDSLTEQVLANLVVEYYQNNQKVDSLVAGQSYVVKFSGLEMSNYNITIEDANLNINTEQLYFVYTNLTDLVYDNTNKMFTVQAYAEAGETDILITDATPVITYQGKPFTGATSAGEYEVTVSINSSYGELTENVTFIINQATIDLSGVALVGDTVSYTGQNQMISVQNLPENDKLVVSYNISEAVNAGTYDVVATISSNDPNYKVSKSEFTAILVITKAANSVTVEIEGWTYGDEAKAPTASATFGEATFTYATEENGDYTSTVPIDAGTYYVKATVAGTDNYEAASATQEFAIAQATIDLSGVALVGDTVSYTGQNQMISVQNLPENDKLVVSYNISEAVNAGTYDVVATISSNDPNYKVSKSEFTATLVIIKAVNSVTVAIQGWTYGDEAKAPTATETFGEATFTYATEENGEYTSTVPTEAGTYYVKATVTGTDNYEAASATQEFTISPKHLDNETQGVEVIVLGSDYNTSVETTLTPSVEVYYNQTQITTYDELQYAYGNAETKLGTATVTIVLNGNYEGTLTATFVVTEFGQAGVDAAGLPETIDEAYLTAYALPVTVGQGEVKSNVLWISSNTAVSVKNENGQVSINKAQLAEDTTITLTAIVTYGTTSSYVKEYNNVTIYKAPVSENLTDGDVTIYDAPYGYDIEAKEVTDTNDNANYKAAVEANEGYEYVKAYNISLKDELGQSAKPGKTVKVRINGSFDTSKVYKVYYVDGSSTTEIEQIKVDATYIEFETNHFSIYAIAVEEEEVHVHTPAEAVEDARVESTCTVAGHYYSVIKCSECSEEISRTKVDLKLADHKEEVVKGYDATCTENGLTDGSKCSVCNTVLSEQEIIPAGHIHENDENTCDRCGYIKVQSWILVTDVTDLTIGDQIVIVASGSDVALSKTQNGNNRGQTAVTKANNTVIFGSDVQEIILMAGVNANTWAFNVGNGYLYAASSSSNQLKTETTLSANSSWTIEISAEGVATIKATGTNTRNWMRYNSQNILFACYASGQQDISIYKNIVEYKDPTQINMYTVTFKVDGNIEHTYTVNEGEKVDQPDNPLKDDHTFVCWMNQDSEFDFNTPINSDIELVAKFSPNTPDVPSEDGLLVTFEFGANGTAAHKDGSSLSANQEYTEGNYTLTLTTLEKVYDGAFDAKGNSCLKFGTGSAAGKMTITVPEEVTKVVIYVAGYKDSNAKLTINGTSYTVSTPSNKGDYTAIEIDTTTTKTISFTTVSGGYRAMVNTIEFYGTK